MSRYSWTEPKALKGEKWWFYDHTRKGVRGNLLLGMVMLVQTDYDHHGAAYHDFHMQVEGYSRRRVVGEASLQDRWRGN